MYRVGYALIAMALCALGAMAAKQILVSTLDRELSVGIPSTIGPWVEKDVECCFWHARFSNARAMRTVTYEYGPRELELQIYAFVVGADGSDMLVYRNTPLPVKLRDFVHKIGQLKISGTANRVNTVVGTLGYRTLYASMYWYQIGTWHQWNQLVARVQTVVAPIVNIGHASVIIVSMKCASNCKSEIGELSEIASIIKKSIRITLS